ncbi:shikimate dehydrogenase [Bacillus alkalisoli]|uniref:shikimate dehydrogenase n=1 Tax=Bacillus alkalisoli TaxID=2011008 RepID=UPI000C23F3B2|nr:shikimate dehydrogenase [Bacillus alkalisoli]
MKKLFGVIGDPIAQSMSPQIHNDAFEQHNIDGVYLPFHVAKDALQTSVKGWRALGGCGFNVTIPHKVKIMQFLDGVDQDAQQIGAVNTVVNESGKLVGYNTDGAGFVKGLKEITSFHEKNVAIIGAGGAARAILYSLSKENVEEITVANRTESKALELIKSLHLETLANASSILQLEETLSKYDIIINTTSVGMYPNEDEMPISLSFLKKNCVVSDIIYNPLETKFLKEAKKQGAITQNGVPMFVNQAAIAFEIWTNIKPCNTRMEQIVMEHLGGKTC